MRKALVSSVIVALFTIPASAQIRPGETAPNYVITTFDKGRISSDELRGQVVIIHLWATWCAPCKRELPVLDTYYRAHARQGLRIFAVTTQDSGPDIFLKSLSTALAFPLVHHISSGRFRVLEGVPTNYVIDRQGIVRYAEAAAFDETALDTVIGPLLAEPATPMLAATTVAQ